MGESVCARQVSSTLRTAPTLRDMILMTSMSNLVQNLQFTITGLGQGQRLPVRTVPCT